jgi:methylmalonyl-CoA mutase N-terminal domain/subunit
MRERFKAARPESWLFRTGAGSGASQLTAQQPENNIVRIALHSLSAILGGAQSLHTAAYDEALALPTEESVMLALRTQQVLACEAGVTEVVDPLAGSYYVESMTNQIEARAIQMIEEIERQGGMVKAIESGWAQRQVAEAAWDYQRAVENGSRVVVGVNRFVDGGAPRVRLHEHAERHEAEQAQALARLRAERDSARVAHALGELRAAAGGDANLLPVLVETVKTYATIGEIFGVLREAFGEYRAPQVF